MLLKSIILGIVQGFTEFLPISSSGHLALLEKAFGIEEPVALAAFLHFGTLIATVIYFRKEIATIAIGLFKRERDSISYLINMAVGTIPIVGFAVFFRSAIEGSFNDPRLIGIFLGATGIVLVITSLFKPGDKPLNWFKALLIGVGQMLAVFPGLSRSGITISTGMLTKVNPKTAFQFSFLLSLPAVFGANLFELINLEQSVDVVSVCTGLFFSALSGLLALFIVRRMIEHYFHLFGIYCLIISVIMVLA